MWDDDIDTLVSLDVVDFPDLPHAPSFPKEHLPTVFLTYRKSNPMWELVKDGMIANSASWGCVFNTFDAIEGEYLEYSRKKMGHERVFAVGPLSLLGGPDHTTRGSTSRSSGSDNTNILAWLDDVYPDGSVLYVCFGSQKLLKRVQMEALSSALEQCGIKFIWVVKSPTAQQVADGYGFVSDEFEKRVSGRGLIIKEWAPQVSILNHRAVGGFLSHCGWNSVLEAIVSGVTILGWPMEADQFVNAKLLVDYMGVAIRVCEGPDIVPNSFELAKKVAESMNAEITEKMRAKELKVKALEGVKHCGSSSRDLDGLVKELAQLQLKNDR